MLSGALQSLWQRLRHLFGGETSGTSRRYRATEAQIIEIEAGVGPAWGTLSSLTAHPTDPVRLFAVTDQDSPPPRIIEIEVSGGRARAVAQIDLEFAHDASISNVETLDLEGLAMKPGGGFWLASEGSKGNLPPNVLIEVDAAGRATRIVHLPHEVQADVRRQGFEGVALVAGGAGSGLLAVAFQSGFKSDPDSVTRIGLVDIATGTWRFWRYPVEEFKDDAYTGLSDILHVGDQRFAMIERDGRAKDTSVKWVTVVDLGSVPGAPPGTMPPLVAKRRVADLAQLFVAEDRKVEKEIEGLTIAADGEVYAITDNDNERATVLIRLGQATSLFGR